MARRRIVSGARSTRSNRKPTNWGGTVAAAQTTVPTATKVLLTTIVPEFVSGETIRRLRGTLFVQGALFYSGAIGAFVANDLAIAAGAGSLLDPVTDVQDDAWFWYQSFQGDGSGPSPGSAGNLGGQLLMVDNKAMRRVETGFQVAFMVANAGANLLTISLSLRALGSESR